MTQQWNDAIEQAYKHRDDMYAAVDLKLDTLLGDWLSSTLQAAFVRWTCEDEKLPKSSTTA